MLVNNDDAIWKGVNKDDSSNFNLKYANLQKKTSKKVHKPLEIQINTVESLPLPRSGNPTPSNQAFVISPSFRQPYNKFTGSFHENSQNIQRPTVKSPRDIIAFSNDYCADVEDTESAVNRISSINLKQNDLVSINTSNNRLNPFITAKDSLKRSIHSHTSQHLDDDVEDTEEFAVGKAIHGNLSTRFSTNESNESFDSNTNNNKCILV